MFRPRSLFVISTAICVSTLSCTQVATAQGAQYSAQGNQIALTTPSVATGTQMLRSEASVLFSSGQYAAAAEVYKRLLQLGSVDASDRYWLGESLYHAKNFQPAATAFEQTIQINHKFGQAYVRLAETYLTLHQKNKAVQTCNGGLNVVTDSYMKEQLSNLLKVSIHQERKPVRSRDVSPAHLPSES